MARTSGTSLFKAIRPRKKVNYVREINKEINKILLEESAIIKRMYARITRTWKHRPIFLVTIYPAGSRMKRAGFTVYTNNDIFHYLDKGTSIRWAVMSRDFRPKTSHRTIGSKMGRGGPVIVGKRAMIMRGIPPRPGIKAGEWTLEIAKRRRGPFVKKMRIAVAKGARRAASQAA